MSHRCANHVSRTMVSAAEAAKTVPVISVILLRFYKNAQGCQSGIHRNIDEGCLAVTIMQKNIVQTLKQPMPSKRGLTRAVYPERNDSSIMTLSIIMRWVVTQTNGMIPSMTRYAATTRSRRCPRESEPLACLKFESKQRVIFPLATVAMAYSN